MKGFFVVRRPSPSMLVATTALFVALGGTSYAAFSLPKNSVGTKQLKNGAVTTKKIKNGSVTASKIANGAVTAAKLNVTGVTVPNALHANSANSATNATNASNATNATNASQLGGLVASGYQRGLKWALVQPNGTIAAQSGGITVTPSATPGRYGIDFGSPTAGHLILASSALANDIGFRGVVSAAPCTGGTPEAYAGQSCPGGNGANRAEVFTDNAGESATAAHAFYVVLVP